MPLFPCRSRDRRIGRNLYFRGVDVFRSHNDESPHLWTSLCWDSHVHCDHLQQRNSGAHRPLCPFKSGSVLLPTSGALFKVPDFCKPKNDTNIPTPRSSAGNYSHSSFSTIRHCRHSPLTVRLRACPQLESPSVRMPDIVSAVTGALSPGVACEGDFPASTSRSLCAARVARGVGACAALVIPSVLQARSPFWRLDAPTVRAGSAQLLFFRPVRFSHC